MKTMYYVVDVRGFYNSKNRLEESIKQYFKSLNRRLLYWHEVEKFKYEILKRMAELNLQHKTCKPVTASWKGGSSYSAAPASDDVFLFIGNGDVSALCRFTLMACRREDTNES